MSMALVCRAGYIAKSEPAMVWDVAMLMCVVCTVLALLVTKHSSRIVLVFMKPKGSCISRVSIVLLFVGSEKKMCQYLTTLPLQGF